MWLYFLSFRDFTRLAAEGRDSRKIVITKTMKRKILLGLTTTPKSDWRRKAAEINEIKLKEIALFPTMLGLKERKELYGLLEKTCLEKIPHVHLRDDMENWELEYLQKKYKAWLFNIHYRDSDIEFLKNNPKYAQHIYVENLDGIDKNFLETAKLCGGICLDVSHCQDLTVLCGDGGPARLMNAIKNFKIGCCHISAVLPKSHWAKSLRTKKMVKILSSHYLHSLRELDYIKNYLEYLPKIISIELENSFKEQIEARNYLEKIING
ncbi:MAG: hypothetical protein FJZ04_02345 [Candidatus Moranbacteria bacterium]|nr:hypothetical protein [Candidatus Moranbacteria bacterium]